MAFQDYPAFSSTPTYVAAAKAARRSRIASIAFLVAALVWAWSAFMVFSAAQNGDERARIALAIAGTSVVLDLTAAALAWNDRARFALRIYAVVRTFLALGGIVWANVPAYLVAVLAIPPRDDFSLLRSVPHQYRPQRPPLWASRIGPLVRRARSDPRPCICGLPRNSELHREVQH